MIGLNEDANTMRPFAPWRDGIFMMKALVENRALAAAPGSGSKHTKAICNNLTRDGYLSYTKHQRRLELRNHFKDILEAVGKL